MAAPTISGVVANGGTVFGTGGPTTTVPKQLEVAITGTNFSGANQEVKSVSINGVPVLGFKVESATKIEKVKVPPSFSFTAGYAFGVVVVSVVTEGGQAPKATSPTEVELEEASFVYWKPPVINHEAGRQYEIITLGQNKKASVNKVSYGLVAGAAETLYWPLEGNYSQTDYLSLQVESLEQSELATAKVKVVLESSYDGTNYTKVEGSEELELKGENEVKTSKAIKAEEKPFGPKLRLAFVTAAKGSAVVKAIIGTDHK